MKEFDLELAKQGKPVCTRDGRKARIICFDRKGKYNIVALIEDCNHDEEVAYIDNNGCAIADEENNLMMLTEKKSGWINVYKERIYKTKDDAIRNIAPGTHFIDTIKVEWEE